VRRQSSGIIERTYHFRADQYEFDASVRASDAVLAGAQNVAWTFGPGIGPTEASKQDDWMAFKANALLGEEFHRKRPASVRTPAGGEIQRHAELGDAADQVFPRGHLSRRTHARRCRDDR
jgi:hypothetical protein